jgi:hypothetical protein
VEPEPESHVAMAQVPMDLVLILIFNIEKMLLEKNTHKNNLLLFPDNINYRKENEKKTFNLHLNFCLFKNFGLL